MRVITWIFRIIILVALIFLAVQNTTPTRFTIFNDIVVDLPLIALLFGFFALGVFLGVLLLLPKYLSLKWGARKLRKEVDAQKVLIEKSNAAENDDQAVDVPLTM